MLSNTVLATLRRLAPLAWLLLVAACGSNGGYVKAEAIQLEPNEMSEADRFMPLEDGMVYVYRTQSGTGTRGIMTIQVRRTTGGRVELRTAGRTEKVKVDPSGIRYVEGGYMLKAPLEADMSWDGEFGTVRLGKRELEVAVPAGHFKGCLQTIEERRRAGVVKAVTSTYCPKIGLVSIEMSSTEGGREVAQLERVGQRQDPMAAEMPIEPEK